MITGENYDQNSSFSEYEILKTLGEGGFGKVVLAVHRQTKEKVAIKFINSSAMGNNFISLNKTNILTNSSSGVSDVDIIFKEANMLKAMNHKNIVKILNCYSLKNDRVVFIMEYLQGGELLEYVNKKAYLSEEESQIFFKQLTDAVHYCHKENLVHRDLKLENILLADKESKTIKVLYPLITIH